MIGKTIAHYEVTALLGRGGMGEVYHAHDPRTGRDIAIKSLPAQVAADPERLARFRREARTLASLNHPNIAALYGVEEQDGHSYLIMEMAEGEDLATRLARGPIDLHEALEIALQIAQGLEEAHEKGVVHRDLKPANIRLAPDGTVKILDFGLARAYEGSKVDGEADPMLSPTITTAMTEAGTVLGTAAYMSPEQARGRGIDRRSDLWAFGVILFEMLSGHRLFTGDTISDTIASVLKTDPDWDSLPAETPSGVRRLLERCLERDVRNRLRDVGEARIRLERWKSDPSSMDESFGTTTLPALASNRSLRVLPWLVATLATLTALFFATRAPRVEDDPALVAEIRLAQEEDIPIDVCASLTPSPDGRHFLWTTDAALYLRDRATLETDRVPARTAISQAAFSPDGRSIAYVDGEVLYRRNVTGGSSIEVHRLTTCRGLTWVGDDRIVVSPNFTSSLVLLDLTQGSQRELTTLAEGERSHRWPFWIPGTDEVLFMTQSVGRDYRDSAIEAVSVSDGTRRVIHRGGAFPRWSPTGHLLFALDQTIMAISYHPGDERATGLAFPVIENVLTLVGDQEVDDGSAQYGFDQQGTMMFRTATSVAMEQTRLAWLDLATGVLEPFGDPGRYEVFGVSPDGRSIAVRRGFGVGSQVVVIDTESGGERILTRDRRTRLVGTWSPTSQEVYWTQADQNGKAFEVLRAPADGSREPEFLARHSNTVFADAVSPDGRWVYVSFWRPGSSYDLGRIDLEVPVNERRIEPVVEDRFDQGYTKVSPDGRLLLYGNGPTGSEEFLVRYVDDPRGARWRIGDTTSTLNMQREMLWSADGTSIFVIDETGLSRIPVSEDSNGLRIGREERLNRPVWRLRPNTADTGVSPDGQRLLVNVPVDGETENEPPRIVLRTGWFDEIRRLQAQETGSGRGR